jgi:hypothetical protein
MGKRIVPARATDAHIIGQLVDQVWLYALHNDVSGTTIQMLRANTAAHALVMGWAATSTVNRYWRLEEITDVLKDANQTVINRVIATATLAGKLRAGEVVR